MEAPNTELSGPLPHAVESWKKLELLMMQKSMIISGQIPASVSSWQSLSSLDLSKTRASGLICDAVAGWRSLRPLAPSGVSDLVLAYESGRPELQHLFYKCAKRMFYEVCCHSKREKAHQRTSS